MNERHGRSQLHNLINEPVHLALSPDGARHFIMQPGQGMPMERALQRAVAEREWTQYTVADDYVLAPMELVLAPATRFETSVEEIQEILNVDESYLNRTINKQSRKDGQDIRYIIFHTTISAAWERNPYAVLNYLLTRHQTPQGEIAPSTTWLLPATDLPDGRGGRNWRMFKYISDDYLAYHAGRGHYDDRKDPTKHYLDNMNLFSIGIEVDNDGKHPIRKEQFAMLVYLTMKYHHDHNVSWQRMIGHDEWAPGRKFDPQSICYLVDNVIQQAQKYYKDFFGDDWEAPDPQPDEGKDLITIRDGYRSNVRQDYKVLAPVALQLLPGTPFHSVQQYTDGMLVAGSRNWAHVTQVMFEGREHIGSGFMHASRYVGVDHPQIFRVRPGNNEVRRVASRMQAIERTFRVQDLRRAQEVRYECC